MEKILKRIEYSLKALFCIFMIYTLWNWHIVLYELNEFGQRINIGTVYANTHLIPFLFLFAVLYVIKLFTKE